jgi:hypothetical protein
LRQRGFGVNILQIRFLGDPTAKFTEALDLAFDGTAIFGGPRSKRYAIEIEGGKVKALHIEPDNTGLNGISPLFPSIPNAPTKLWSTVTPLLFHHGFLSFQGSALTFTSFCSREGSRMKSFRWPRADVGDDTPWMSALRG